ncbi:hypothetical protein [Rhizobium sp. BK602]|uniref:ParE family toxin-like protein n=1 Tax=Rhizobium sp. BK602 TaxID=2586986 RepID=UPI00161A5808|nr:hypothetical protein [Rhizobium sp. BK602]
MKHHAAPSFWQAYEKLPQHVRELADRNFELLKANPKHPSLHFKPVGRFWSARVGISWRALAVADGDDLIWFWIGSHTDYDKLLR